MEKAARKSGFYVPKPLQQASGFTIVQPYGPELEEGGVHPVVVGV